MIALAVLLRTASVFCVINIDKMFLISYTMNGTYAFS